MYEVRYTRGQIDGQERILSHRHCSNELKEGLVFVSTGHSLVLSSSNTLSP